MKTSFYIILFTLVFSVSSYAQDKILSESDKKLQAMKGTQIPEMILPDMEWNDVKLSDVKGKVILVDFWASWCGYCRSINQEIASLYDVYHKDGFEIVSISFDSDYNKWKKASQRDGVTWINLNDKIGMDSETAKLFNINHTPTSFLLDENRNVIDIDLEGVELEEKIKELLK